MAKLKTFRTLKNSFQSLLSLSPQTPLCVLALTAAAYILIDFFPIQSINAFKAYEARVVVSLWQSVVWGLYSMGLSFFILYSLAYKKGLIDLNFFKFFKKNLVEYITAQLRILIHTSLWFLVFILPGFIMYVRYSLSNAVIFFHPQFHSDRSIDPLTLSKKSVGLKQSGFIFLYLASAFLVPLVIDSIFQHAHFMFEPQGRFIQIFLYSFLYLFLNALIFNTYLDVREENYV